MPTRFQANSSSSLIDHVYSTSPERLEVENVPNGTSDHNLVGIRRKNGAAVDRPRMMKKRVFHNFSQEEFRKEVEKEDWDRILKIEDLNEVAQTFNSKFGEYPNCLSKSEQCGHLQIILSHLAVNLQSYQLLW